MLSEEDLQKLADGALELAQREMEERTHSNFEQRARRYMRLADAADAIHAMAVRDTYYQMWGEPAEQARPNGTEG